MTDGLLDVLEVARARGFLGPGEVEGQIAHARGFLAALEGCTGLLVDLGSGGGIPGLVLALERTDLTLVLVDAMARRCRFLEEAIDQLGLARRCRVEAGRAELVGRGNLRSTAAVVVARSFGPPAVTAECAAPLLRVGGRLVVSEPPAAGDRWPAGPLQRLGLRPGPAIEEPYHYQVLEQVRLCPAAFPRPPGRPAKRPLF